MMSEGALAPDLHSHLLEGTVIPAHPLALDENRRFDQRRQRALTRYYMAAGAGGIAVGVHTTQFEIRKPQVGLLEPVLELAAQTVREEDPGRPFVKVAGICGPTPQAVDEAELAAGLGYDVGLLSNGGLGDWSEHELLRRSEAVAERIPIFGFYLQPAVGGRHLSYGFWRDFCDLPGVVAIKLAPFDRYATIEVVRAVCTSPRAHEIALYTGNDDNIVVDLITLFRVQVEGRIVEKRIVGGLLGHWAAWTQAAVRLLAQVKALTKESAPAGSDTLPAQLLTEAAAVTDMNAALFDPANDFRGCIPGIHEVLRRQGLLAGRWCLDPNEELSPGQLGAIDRVEREYPHLTDNDFVAAHRDEWLRD